MCSKFTEFIRGEVMPKNVTVQIGDDLLEKMDALPDVNWSQVVRKCIEKYCVARLNPNIEALIKKMKDQKGEAFANGQELALEWFKQESVRYENVDEIFQNYYRTKANTDSYILDNRNSLDDGFDPNAMRVRKERNFWINTIEAVRKQVDYDPKDTSFDDITDGFIDGFRDALNKLR